MDTIRCIWRYINETTWLRWLLLSGGGGSVLLVSLRYGGSQAMRLIHLLRHEWPIRVQVQKSDVWWEYRPASNIVFVNLVCVMKWLDYQPVQSVRLDYICDGKKGSEPFVSPHPPLIGMLRRKGLVSTPQIIQFNFASHPEPKSLESTVVVVAAGKECKAKLGVKVIQRQRPQ